MDTGDSNVGGNQHLILESVELSAGPLGSYADYTCTLSRNCPNDKPENLFSLHPYFDHSDLWKTYMYSTSN